MDVISDLRNQLPANCVISEREALKVFECDALSSYCQLPKAVVLVDCVEQIKIVLSIARKHNTPVVTRGAGTGLSGGALPLKNGIVLGLSKLKRILDIDLDNKIAVVEPGVTNLSISQAVEQYGLYYAPDPSSQIACSIGGNVAENSGGVHCLKYGLTVHNVAAIKVLMANGDEHYFSEDDEGIDLLALMIGSEGLLGIVTEVSVKLTPKPDAVSLLVAGFSSVDDCANAVADIIKAGVIPAGLEMMDRLALDAIEDFLDTGYPKDAKALLLCELDGEEAEVKREVVLVKALLNKASSVIEADDEAHRLILWQGRKSAFPAMGRVAPDMYCMDGTIPRAQLSYVLNQIERLSQQYQFAVANVFHAGDGNLHPLILYDINEEGALAKVEEMGNKILKLCIDVGGTITGEHGVGVEKLDAMCHQFGEQELTIFHGIKRAFDGDGLLNPGKAVPTLNRCAEFGKMHIHQGQLPHPELERF